MQRVSPTQTNFTGGELSPLIHGRHDTSKFANGARTLENMIVRSQGGAFNRKGSQMTHIMMRYQESVAPGWHQTTKFVFDEQEKNYFIVHLKRANTGPKYVLDIYPPTLAYVETVAIPTAWDIDPAAFPSQIYDVQSGNTLYLFFENFPPLILRRTSTTGGTIGTWAIDLLLDKIENGPYADPISYDNSIPISLTNVVSRLTVTSSNADFAANAPGDFIEFSRNGVRSLGIIVTKHSSTSVTVQPLTDRCYEMSDEITSPGTWWGVYDAYGAPAIVAFTTPQADVTVAFSKSNVVTSKMIGRYVRFAGNNGQFYWMRVDSIIDNTRSGSYGWAAHGDMIVYSKTTGRVEFSDESITSTLVASDSVFSASDVGCWFRFKFKERVIHARITVYSGPTQCTAELSTEPPPAKDNSVANSYEDNGSSVNWLKGLIDSNNFPTCGCFHEGRFVIAGFRDHPQTFAMSNVEDYYDMSTTDSEGKVLDSSGITKTVSTDTVHGIRWLMSQSVLLFGTFGSEGVISAGGQIKQAITPTNITANPNTFHGSERIKPVSVGQSIVFVERGGKRLREMFYDYSIDQHKSIDITIFSEHLFSGDKKVVQLDKMGGDETLLAALNDAGEIAVCTFQKDHEVVAWTPWKIAAHTGGTQFVTGINALPVAGTSRWALFLTVMREQVPNDPNSVLLLEQINPIYKNSDVLVSSDNVYLDCYVEKTMTNGVPESPDFNTNVPFLNTWPLSVLFENGYVLDLPGGYVTFVANLPPSLASFTGKIWYGLKFSSIIRSMPFNFDAMFGTSQGKTKRMDHISILLHKSAWFKHGKDLSRLRDEKPVTVGSSLWSSVQRVTVDLPFDTDAGIYIVQSGPFPLNVLALFPEITAYN